MKHATYDEPLAIRLVPYLRSITDEIQERTMEAARLEHELESLDAMAATGESTPRHREIEGRIFLQRREIARATREIEKVGCALDADHPLRILIPGQDGEFDHGYAWTPLDETISS